MAKGKAARQPGKTRARSSNIRKANTGEEASNVRLGLPFPVVAVGASAGGLAAFTALLKALSIESGMAFVLIQHLEPSHESALTALLSNATRMPVVEVSDGITLKPNHVYVIPPNKNMTIRAGTLRLTPRSDASGPQRPIDGFSIALAEEQGKAAIGVVLSGTGTDGTHGLKAIKAAGGVTFAQEPKTAQWPAMPVSAIAAGAVDFVLSPRRIAVELGRIGRHPYLSEARAAPESSDLDKICLILRSSVGVDFRLYKQATVHRRVARRMALRKIASLSKYAQILKQSREEAQALADDIFIHVTSFFRDPDCFQVLRKRVLAKLRARGAAGDPIRIWVPGCSTGEEVYSVAMLLLEDLGEQTKQNSIHIFGTDIQERAVEHARAGLYTEAGVAGVSRARLKRFFVKTESGYQIQKFARDLCVFACHDLAKDPPFSRLDLISCRNVLIYLGTALQKRVLSLFQYALKPGGFLFLGNSESIGDYSDIFAAEDGKHRILLRKTAVAGIREPHSASAHFQRREVPPPRVIAGSAEIDFRQDAEAILLEQYAPPALIVDADLRIVHFQGDTSPYLAPATGQPSFHLLKMVRPELVVDLRTAIYKARRERTAVHKDVVQFEHEGQLAAVRLEVRPLRKRDGNKQDLLVVFRKSGPAGYPEGTRTGSAAIGRKRPAERTERLERELASSLHRQRSLIAEHEAAREEMKAANEEILSSNEELQSTNEELETAKEELQSSNEELVTLNDELQNRNAELNVLTQDLTNLLSGLDIPVLVLDANLRVRRFTPVAGALLNLIPGDVGRPFSNIVSNLDVADWKEVFSRVTGQGQLVERQVCDRNGHRYSLRVRPYRTSGNDIAGVLVFLFDIDAIEHALDEARESRDLALKAEQRSESILNSLTAHVAVIAQDGTILATNNAWNRFAQENGVLHPKAVGPGANYLQICRRAISAGVPEAQVALDCVQRVLEGHRVSAELEYPCHSPAEQHWFLMSVSLLQGTKSGVVIAHANVTDRKLAEIAARESTIRALLESSAQSVVAVNARGKIVLVNGYTETMFGYTRKELLGQPLEILVPEGLRGRHADHRRDYFSHMESRPMGMGLNLQGRRKDGTTFPTEIALSAIETAEGRLAVAFVSDITQRRQLELFRQTHAQEVEALAANLITAQEEERRRVSRDLHDQVCQQLASLAIDIGGLAAELPPPEDTQRKLKDLQARVVRTSEESRHLAYALHPSELDDLGLVASLTALCRQFSEQAPSIVLSFREGALPASLPGEIASCIYRVAQEGLRNITKHAGARHVSVAITFRAGALLLKVEDDGSGFDLKVVKGQGGLGLIVMQERTRLVNGKLSITALPGYGTRIALKVPLPAGAV